MALMGHFAMGCAANLGAENTSLDDSGNELVVDQEFDFANQQVIVTCADGSKETYPFADFDIKTACLPKEPPDKVRELSGFQGIFCASYETGGFRCWNTDPQNTSLGRTQPPSLVGEMSNVDIGFMVACGLDSEHGVRCWGHNEREQLNIPAKFAQPGAARDVVAGEDYVCALTATRPANGKELECWGTYGVTDLNLELPDTFKPIRQIESVAGSLCVVYEDSSLACYGAYPAKPQVTTGVRKLYTNKIVACAELENGTLSCFTDFNPDLHPITKNVPSVAFTNISDIAIGENTACVLRSNGLAKECFGNTNSGENIYPDAAQSATKVVIGNGQYCATKPNGELFCWAFGGKEIAPFTNHKAQFLTAGAASACSIDAQGRSTCWGRRSATSGKYGLSHMFGIDSSFDASNPPYEIGHQTISLGEDHSCFLQQGYLQCRGNDYAGQGSLHEAADIQINRVIVSGLHHNCVIREDNHAVCWGDNALGQTLVPDAALASAKIDAGANHTCVVTTSNEAVCWGDSTFKQTLVPQDLGSVTEVAAGRAHSCAMTSAGPVRCWGDNSLGQTDVPNFAQPVKSLHAGFDHTCAVLTDDTFECWGSGEFRQLLKPIGLSKVKAMALGDGFTCAIRASDDQVTCWGKDTDGQTAVPAVVGLDFGRTPAHVNDTRVLYGANLMSRTTFATVTSAENYGGPVFEYLGIRSASEQPLSYNVKVDYTTDCRAIRRTNSDFGLQIRNPLTSTYVTEIITNLQGTGTLVFENLRGLSELSLSVSNRDFAQSTQAFVQSVQINADESCSFKVNAVNAIPTNETLSVLAEGARFLTRELNESFTAWLKARVDASFVQDAVTGKVAAVEAEKGRIIQRAQTAIFNANLTPSDFGLTAFDTASVNMGLFSSAETIQPTSANGLGQAITIQRPLPESRRAPWFDYLYDLYIDSLNTDAAELILEQLRNYNGMIAVILEGTQNIGSEQGARERLDLAVFRAENFLRQVGFLKASLSDNVRLEIEKLFDIAIEKKSDYCLKGQSEGTVLNAGCQS